MRTYQQARDSELVTEKNQHKAVMNSLLHEIQYLESLVKAGKDKQEKGVKSPKAPSSFKPITK